jgi:hypothetical protein
LHRVRKQEFGAGAAAGGLTDGGAGTVETQIVVNFTLSGGG